MHFDSLIQRGFCRQFRYKLDIEDLQTLTAILKWSRNRDKRMGEFCLSKSKRKASQRFTYVVP